MALPWWLPFGEVVREPPPQLLDVRTAAEFRGGHLRGAVNVPIHELGRALASLPLERSRPVVAICLSAHRSIPAVRLLRRSGYDAAQLRGGMLAWRAARLPEER